MKIQGTSTKEQTFDENIEVLAEGIMKAIELAVQREWAEWDSFSGRMGYKTQPLRDAQKDSVKRFLKLMFIDTPPHNGEVEECG